MALSDPPLKSNPADLHPKLRNDSGIFRTRDGVMFRNDYQTFFLRGEALYPVITALVPLCDGKRTLIEIVSGFPDQSRETLIALVLMLLNRGILKDQPTEADVKLSETARERFSAQIEFIDHVADRPLERFATFRQSRVLLAGSGHSYATCAASLVRYGLVSLSLLPNGDPSMAQHEIAKAIESIKEAGLSVSVSEFDVKSSDFSLLVDKAVLVAHCSDQSDMSVLVRLNRECCRARRPLLPGFVFGERSLMGPMLTPTFPGCWVCGLFRLSDEVMDEHHLHAFSRTSYHEGCLFEEEPETNMAVAELLGHEMAFEIFKVLAGNLRAQTFDSLLLNKLDGRDSFQATLVPHQLCSCLRHCRAFVPGEK